MKPLIRLFFRGFTRVSKCSNNKVTEKEVFVQESHPDPEWFLMGLKVIQNNPLEIHFPTRYCTFHLVNN